jgi:hypothetical protein
MCAEIGVCRWNMRVLALRVILMVLVGCGGGDLPPSDAPLDPPREVTVVSRPPMGVTTTLISNLSVRDDAVGFGVPVPVNPGRNMLMATTPDGRLALLALYHPQQGTDSTSIDVDTTAVALFAMGLASIETWALGCEPNPTTKSSSRSSRPGC